MNKKFQEFKLIEKMSQVKEIAQNILKDSFSEERSCYSLAPLALALKESVDLYSMFYYSSDSANLSDLFYGVETECQILIPA